MRRRASRFMPKAVQSKTPLWGWLLGAAILGFFGWILFFFLPPLLGAAFLAFFVIATIWGNAATERRLRNLAAARAGGDIGTFARSFDCRMINTWIIRAVHEEFQDYLCDGFPLRPEDQWREDLEIDEEDFGMDLVPRIAQRAGRSLESTESNPYYGKVQTIGDLVRFLNLQPRSSTLSDSNSD